MYEIKFADLEIFNNLLLGTFWYVEPFLRYSGPKKRGLVLDKLRDESSYQWSVVETGQGQSTKVMRQQKKIAKTRKSSSIKFTKYEKEMKGAVFEFGREFFLQRLEIMPVRSSNKFFRNFSFTN